MQEQTGLPEWTQQTRMLQVMLSVCEVSWTGLQVGWTGARMSGLSPRNLEHSAANALISRGQVAAEKSGLVCTSVHETSHICGQSMKPGTRRAIATG
jgi:hypothetical protein